MDTLNKEKAPEAGEVFLGISLSDGEPVHTEAKDLYLDEVFDTEEDKRDIETAKKNTMTPMDKRIITVLWLLNAAVFAFIGLFINFTGSDDAYAPIKEEARFEGEEGAASYYDGSLVFGDSITPNYAETEYPSGMIKGFEPLYSENSDTVGWIRIPDTNVDHVILQTDNHTDYDRTTFFGDYYVGGSLFMDYRNRIAKGSNTLSKNTIIYGHYLKNQRGMFSDLDKYMDVEYYKEHPVIEMSTLYSRYQWKIIGAFIAVVEEQYDNSLFYYWYDNFSDSNTLGFANEVAFRSYFVNPAIDVQPTDKFLTLSTCSHSMDIDGMVNARFVVVARLVRDGESAEVDVSAAYENPTRRMPQLWYDQNGLQNPYSQYAIWDAFA
ncbi:MAG: class B sortase [Clostridia bacterium]|nr:class B sortase [Clostridia bacterium]